MKILVLNGSPRSNGNTAKMIDTFCKTARAKAHEPVVVDVCKKNIAGCVACEFCHTGGEGQCAQMDDMQEVYELMREAEMLVLASPIYYHGFSGQLKCAIDRFYALLYPEKPEKLTKIAMMLSSGDDDVYESAIYEYNRNFIVFSGFEDMGIVLSNGDVSDEDLKEVEELANSL